MKYSAQLKNACGLGYRDGSNKGIDIREMEYGRDQGSLM